MSSNKNLVFTIGSLALVAAIVLGILGLSSAYNNGKIGHKAQKVADTFTTDIIGSWTGKHSVSKMEFKDDGTIALTMLGVVIDGTYSDSYDLNTQVHTLTLKYSTVLGVSVERSYVAKLDGDKLSLTDTQFDSAKLYYTRDAANSTATKDNKKDKSDKSEIYNPGIDVYQQEILGEWKVTNGKNSGYTFKDSSTVSIKLLGVSYDGTYSVSVDEATGRCELKITYASLAGLNVSNRYYVTIADDVLTLTQIGAESVSTTYQKV